MWPAPRVGLGVTASSASSSCSGGGGGSPEPHPCCGSGCRGRPPPPRRSRRRGPPPTRDHHRHASRGGARPPRCCVRGQKGQRLHGAGRSHGFGASPLQCKQRGAPTAAPDLKPVPLVEPPVEPCQTGPNLEIRLKKENTRCLWAPHPSLTSRNPQQPWISYRWIGFRPIHTTTWIRAS